MALKHLGKNKIKGFLADLKIKLTLIKTGIS
jgi:hypothetical protein